MTLAALEANTLKKQLKNADKDFERAFDEMTTRNSSVRGKKMLL